MTESFNEEKEILIRVYREKSFMTFFKGSNYIKKESINNDNKSNNNLINIFFKYKSNYRKKLIQYRKKRFVSHMQRAPLILFMKVKS